MANITLPKYAACKVRVFSLLLVPAVSASLYIPISHAEVDVTPAAENRTAVVQSLSDQRVVDKTAIQQGIRLYNQAKIKQAKAVLQAEADKGSAIATYWLGITQYESGERYRAGDSFLKAAKMGDPWAMDLLVPGGNSPCDYLGWPCDEAWHEKAMAGWEKLAAKDSGKAKYAMYEKGDNWWQYIPFYRQKVRNEIHYDIIQHKGYGIFKNGAKWDSNEQQTVYLIMAAEDGYASGDAKLILFR